MADFKPDSERAQKKFPNMRMTRAMVMDRIDHSFRMGGKSGRTEAINKFNSVSSKGSQSGGFNTAEMKIARAWFKKAGESLKTKTSSKGGGNMAGNPTIDMGSHKVRLVKDMVGR